MSDVQVIFPDTFTKAISQSPRSEMSCALDHKLIFAARTDKPHDSISDIVSAHVGNIIHGGS